jgi:hypothetical protein
MRDRQAKGTYGWDLDDDRDDTPHGQVNLADPWVVVPCVKGKKNPSLFAKTPYTKRQTARGV